MAADDDKDDKTEDASSKRLDDAATEGNVAKSQELKTWFMLAAGALAFRMVSGGALSEFSGKLVLYWSEGWQMRLSSNHIMDVARDVVDNMILVLSIPLGLLFAAGILGSVVQHRLVFAVDKLKPDLSKLSPIKGFGRVFSIDSVVELLKNIVKMVIVGTVVFLVIWPQRGRLDQLPSYDMESLLSLITALVTKLLLSVVAILTFIAGADFMYQRFQHRKNLRMSKQEVREEYKQQEGDPHIKGRLRQLRMERSRRRMMAAVPEASVVITNPTHFAVALKYDPASFAAPKVVAKGADLIAKRIRDLAGEHKVPIVENPPLARALFASVDIDAEIPPEHYKAVAEVIGYVMRLKGRLRPRRPARASMSSPS